MQSSDIASQRSFNMHCKDRVVEALNSKTPNVIFFLWQRSINGITVTTLSLSDKKHILRMESATVSDLAMPVKLSNEMLYSPSSPSELYTLR